MAMKPFRGPVRRKGDGFVIDLGDEESALVRRLIGDLRDMLTQDDADEASQALLHRLFPVAYPNDVDNEAEYQRLMRDELLHSKLAAFDRVDEALSGTGPVDEAGMIAVMQSVNSIRLVVGSLLDVSDDPERDEVAPGMEDSPEYGLYGYLSSLLEHCVRALSGR